MKKVVYGYVLLVMLLSGTALASDWQAEWIGPNADSPPNTWLCYLPNG